MDQRRLQQRLVGLRTKLASAQTKDVYAFSDTIEPGDKPAAALDKRADIKPGVIPQSHQQRVADLLGTDGRLLVYAGLGTGKSLSAILGAEAAKKEDGGDYAVVVPASLRDNFYKELEKFTTDPSAEVMSYTGLGQGKTFQRPPTTLIADEVHRLRNPSSKASLAVQREAEKAKRLLLLSGSPVVNAPSDLAPLISMLTRKKLSPQEFDRQFVGKRKVPVGLLNTWLGRREGVESVMQNSGKLKKLLANHVDYQPSAQPEGVTVSRETVEVPLTAAQQRIQEAIREQIPASFKWKLDREFPLSQNEAKRLNAFLTGLRQSSLSTRTFQAEPDDLKAYKLSGKLQRAVKDLQEMITKDKRQKAIVYSNFIEAGLNPYAAALKDAKIPHAMFHGGMSPKQRQESLQQYNSGDLNALLLGPAGAEGISTKGTNLIQILDPHWNETRGNQAQGRGLRFDSHGELPPELKNVMIRKYISKMPEPSRLSKLFGAHRERTGDEIVSTLAARKEKLNEQFRKLLQELGQPPGKDQAKQASG